MEKVHPEFKEGFNLGLFFGVVLVAILFLGVEALNFWWYSEETSYPPRKVWTRDSSH